MAKYAKNTNVSTESTRLEIEKCLMRYGADGFAYASISGKSMIAFNMQGRQVKIILPLPDINSDEFRFTPIRGTTRSQTAQYEAWEQACRQRWRALLLVVKAKLEAIECGITTFDNEFMAEIVLPSGQTVGDWMKPQMEEAYLKGTPPKLLPLLEE